MGRFRCGFGGRFGRRSFLLRLPFKGVGGKDGGDIVDGLQAAISPKAATVKPGDDIKEGGDLCEMVTDKATFNVPSPATGKVKTISAKEEDVVRVGGLLAVLETK